MGAEPPRPLTTGVGSVPFTGAAAAVAHSFAAYTLPFFPQLVGGARAGTGRVPMLDELLTPPMAAALAARDARALVRALEAASAVGAGATGGADALVAALAAAPEFLARLGGARPAKTQLAGPRTFAALAAAALQASETAALAAAAWGWCEAVTAAWARALRARTSGRLVVVWDDALLALAGTGADRARFAQARHRWASANVALGVHVCAPCELAGLVAALPATLLSVDLSVCDLSSPAARQAAARHVAGGGALFCGIFDTRPGCFDRQRGLALGRLAAPFAAGLTGGCGTGLHPEAFERELAAALGLAAAHPL